MDGSSASFGDALRHLRLAASFSQEELAERAGVSARAISDLERGVRQGPRPETLRLLADALSVDDRDRATLFAAAHRERQAITEPGGSGQVVPLPQPATSLVGRDQDREELSALLVRPDVRLVTLTGMGGIGKTHLAIDVARRTRTDFQDGGAFVDFAPLTDSGHVIPTVARAIGIHESRGQEILRTVIATLGEKRMLLLLDNCEQVLDAASALAELLASCPGVTLLATSREALKMRGEWEWPVLPLSLPDLAWLPPLDELQASAAVALFTARAQATDPRFALTTENALAVATICHRVDGIPLAIELAAARVKLLTPEALAARLEQRLPLLTGGARDAPARQRTLRAALAWSYDLLTPEEQAIFRRLGVFVGGWTLEAAEAVANPTRELNVLDGLGSLLDKSLVRSHQHGLESRYGMFETVREFALDQLDREGECETTRERHAAYFLTFAEREPSDRKGITKIQCRGLLETEHPNLQQALATMAAREDDAGHLRLTGALTWFWLVRCHAAEGLPHVERVLARESGMTLARAQALQHAGSLAYACGAYDRAERWLQEGEELARALGETTLLAHCHLLRGVVAEHLGDEASAQSSFEAGLALAQEIGSNWLIGLMLANLSDAAYRRGEIDLADHFAREGRSALAMSGDAYVESMNFCNIAQVALARGAIGDAAKAFKEALRIAEEIESRWNVANVVAGAAAVSAALGIHAQATRLLGAADMGRERSGHPRLPHFGLFAQTQEAVQGMLDDEAYQAGWNAGRSLSTEEAVTEARAVFAAARRDA